MSDPVRRFEFIISVQIYDTRRRANKVRDALCDRIEDWSIDYGDTVRGMTVDVEPVKVLKREGQEVGK